MYVKDFLRELDKLNIEIGQEELDEINRISDSTGKVFPPQHKFSQNKPAFNCIQITKAEFEKHCHHSEVYSNLFFKIDLKIKNAPRFTKRWTRIGTERLPPMSWTVKLSWLLR